MEQLTIYRCDGSNGGCGQVSIRLRSRVGQACPYCGKGKVEAVGVQQYEGNSGTYTVIPADNRDDRPWQMMV
jgi:hypothetical protein